MKSAVESRTEELVEQQIQEGLINAIGLVTEHLHVAVVEAVQTITQVDKDGTFQAYIVRKLPDEIEKLERAIAESEPSSSSRTSKFRWGDRETVVLYEFILKYGNGNTLNQKFFNDKWPEYIQLTDAKGRTAIAACVKYMRLKFSD